jgi:2-methylcitrate dehydratase PrpD
VRIIDKAGPLANPADRDHCLQYMTAVPLIHGRLTAADYGEEAARDPRIDALRHRTVVRENTGFTQAYYDPLQRAIPNAVQVHFRDGSSTRRVQVDFPLGHRRRRAEGIPLLSRKFRAGVASRFPPAQTARIEELFDDRERLESTAVQEFVAQLVRP